MGDVSGAGYSPSLRVIDEVASLVEERDWGAGESLQLSWSNATRLLEQCYKAAVTMLHSSWRSLPKAVCETTTAKVLAVRM